MMKKIKGQGALEYLLLIGGAVLIAVIVIALLVGMGGQSRETAQDQATKASKTLDQPQPATIVSILPVTTITTPSGANCGSVPITGRINMNWQKLSEGGTYSIKVYNYNNVAMDVNNASTTGFAVTASPSYLQVTLPAGSSCNDSYWAEIATTKNGQTVTSTRMKFNW